MKSLTNIYKAKKCILKSKKPNVFDTKSFQLSLYFFLTFLFSRRCTIAPLYNLNAWNRLLLDDKPKLACMTGVRGFPVSVVIHCL